VYDFLRDILSLSINLFYVMIFQISLRQPDVKAHVPSFVKGIATHAVRLFPVVSWRAFLPASLPLRNYNKLAITSSKQIWGCLNSFCPRLRVLKSNSGPDCKKAMEDGNSPHNPTVTGCNGLHRNFVREGCSTNSVEGRGHIGRGSGGGSPLVRGSTQFANEWNPYSY
jgi:hypothetical protein